MTRDERDLLLALSWVVKNQCQSIGIDQPYSRESADQAVKLINARTESVLVARLRAEPPRAKYVSIAEPPDLKAIAERWRHFAVDGNGEWNPKVMNGQAEAIYDAIVALGPLPDRDAVADIIGNKSWTHLSCDGCDNEMLRGVQIGGEMGSRHTFCSTCIREAAALAEALP